MLIIRVYNGLYANNVSQETVFLKNLFSQGLIPLYVYVEVTLLLVLFSEKHQAKTSLEEPCWLEEQVFTDRITCTIFNPKKTAEQSKWTDKAWCSVTYLITKGIWMRYGELNTNPFAASETLSTVTDKNFIAEVLINIWPDKKAPWWGAVTLAIQVKRVDYVIGNGQIPWDVFTISF